MEILYITTSTFPPPIWKTDILKITNQARIHWDIVSICCNDDENIVKSWNTNIYPYAIFRPIKFSEKSFFWELHYIYHLSRIFKNTNINPDVVHIYNPFYFAFILNLLIRIFLPKTKIVFDVRTWPLKEWLIKKINYLLITLAHITADETIIIHKNLLKNFYFTKSRKIHEISLWYDKPNLIKQDLKLLWNSRAFVYIWSIYPRRNIDSLLYIFEKYLKFYSDDYLYIIWWGDDKYIEHLKERYDNKNIKFFWSVKHEDIWEFLLESDYWIAYIPQTEYFMNQPPLKTIEYLWYGLPTIWTKTNWNYSFITSKNGIICDQTEKDFLNWLIELRNKYANYNKLSIQRTVKKYEWSNIYRDIRKLYRL